MTGFIFGGDTGVESAAELARKREIVNALMDPGMGMPQTFGEGLTVFGRALAGRIKDKKLGVKEDAERGRVSAAFDAITGQLMPQPGGAMPSAPAAPVDPNSPSAIGADAMSALGKGPGGVDFSAIEKQYGLPSGYLSQTAQIESGMDPNAKNPNSSAEGLFQFIDATASNYGLTNKRDPAASTDAAARLAKDNAAQLRNVLGREPTAGELYLAHQQGGAGASRLLSNPNALASAIVGADAVRLNGGSENMTAGEFANKWTSRLNGQMPQSANPDIVSQLSELASNPYATDAQKAIITQLMGQQMDAMKPQAAPDPIDAINLEKAQLELAQLKNPQASQGFQPMSAQEVAELGLPPGVYQRGPDGRIDTVEKTQATVDPIADLKARALAAGLTEGTPEYQQFMMANGKTDGGMIIESDGQGGFRMAQGAAAGAAGSKPFTEGQSKDVVYSTRAKGALAALDPIAGSLTDRGDVAAGWLPMGLGGGMQGEDYQVAKTAGDEFLQAVLRKDTGAAITPAEQQLYGETYLPRPGDSAERLKYKSEARQRAVDAIDAGMSPAQIVAQERALEKGNPPVPEFDDDAAYLKSLGLE